MKQITFLSITMIVLIGFLLNPVFAQIIDDDNWDNEPEKTESSKKIDNDDDDDKDEWGDELEKQRENDDDDDKDEWGDELEKQREEELYNKAMEGTIEDCKIFLREFPDGWNVEEVKDRLKKLEKEIENPPPPPPGPEKPDPPTDPETPISNEDVAYMLTAGSFWSPNLVSHIHFGITLTFVDWESQLTTGTGSHADLNLGIEFAIEETPLSVLAEFGYRISNKNPWDTDSGFFAGWVGVKFAAIELDIEAEEGFSLSLAALGGFGTGDKINEDNLAIWLGHHHPVLFELTPIFAVSASYKINKTMAVNAELLTMYYLGTDEVAGAEEEIGISLAAEYFIAVKIISFHFGFNFNLAYEPKFMLYANAMMKMGAYIQMSIPLGSDYKASVFALTIGYDMRF